MIHEKAYKMYHKFSTVMEGGAMYKEDFWGLADPATKEDKEVGPLSALQGFQANKGWFHHFQKRSHVTSVSLHGEMANADMEVAAEYPMIFVQIIMDNCYCPE